MSVNRLPRDKKRWYFQFYFEGQKIKKEVWHGKPLISKAEAIQAEYECKQYFQKQKALGIGDMTLYELYDDFVSKTKSNLKVTTKHNYDVFKRNYFLPLIKDKQIHKLTVNDINNWKNAMNNLDITTETKNRVLNIMKSLLEYGNKMYDLKGNIQLPLFEKFKDTTFVDFEKKSKYLPEQDFELMMSYLDLKKDSDFYYYTIFNVLYYCGLRIGELAALTINDFKNSSLIINKNYARINGIDYIQTPKTDSSIRKILVDETTNKLLLDYIERFKPRNVLFHKDKNYLNQQKVRAVLTKLSQASELDLKYIISPHTLRHSHSSNLRQLGFDEVAVSERLGNSPEVALKIYTHTSEVEQVEIAQKLRKK